MAAGLVAMKSASSAACFHLHLPRPTLSSSSSKGFNVVAKAHAENCRGDNPPATKDHSKTLRSAAMASAALGLGFAILSCSNEAAAAAAAAAMDASSSSPPSSSSALSDSSLQAPFLDPDMRALALGPGGPMVEEFWDNMRRYGLYFLTVATGGIYSLLQPIGELLKNPISAILTLVVISGSFYLLFLVLNSMLGVAAFDYRYSS